MHLKIFVLNIHAFERKEKNQNNDFYNIFLEIYLEMNKLASLKAD